MREEIEKWKKTTGIDLIVAPEVDPIKKVLQVGKELSDLPVQDIEEVMLVLSNYSIHLNYELGQIIAKCNYFDSEVVKIVSSVPSNHKYFIEKRQAVLNENKKAAELDGLLCTERAKLEMLKPIIDSLRNKLEVVKRIHDRRVRGRA